MKYLFLIYIFLIPFSGNSLQIDSTKSRLAIHSVYFYEGLIKKGKVQLPDSLYSKLYYCEDLAALKIIDTTILYPGGSIGFIDRKGKIVVPFVYDTIVKPFENGLAIAGISNDYFNPSDISYGVSTNKGKLFSFTFKEIGTIEKGIIPVRDEAGNWGFYAVSGKPLFTPFCKEFQILSESKILVKENESWGIVDVSGGIVFPIRYKSIKSNGEKFDAEPYPKWSVVNASDKSSLIEISGDSIVSEGGFFKVLQNGKWGIQKQDGTPITKFLFDRIQIYPTTIVVKKSGRYAAMDTMGNYLTGFDYHGMEVDSTGYIKVKIPSFKRYGYKVIEDSTVLWEGLLDSNGTKVIPVIYRKLGKVSNSSKMIRFKEGEIRYRADYVATPDSLRLIPFQSQEGKWGYLNLENQVKIPATYNYAEKFINGRAEVTTERGIVVINSDGKTLVTEDDFEAYKFEMGTIYKIYKKNIDPYYVFHTRPKTQCYDSYKKAGGLYIVAKEGRYGLIDSTGKIVLNTLYDSICYEDTLYAVTLNDQRGYVDSKGNFSMPLTNRYKIISPLQEGHAIIQKGNAYGFIDYLGNLRVSVQYKQVKPFSNGLAAVMINGKWGFIDTHENIIIQPNYADATMFRNGLGRVKTDRRWDFINKKGEKVSSTSYDEISELSDGKYLLMRSYRYGIADINGRELIGAKYDMAEDFGNGYIKVKKDGKFGLTDYQENIIFPFEYDQLLRYKKTGAFILKKNQPKETIQLIDPAK